MDLVRIASITYFSTGLPVTPSILPVLTCSPYFKLSLVLKICYRSFPWDPLKSSIEFFLCVTFEKLLLAHGQNFIAVSDEIFFLIVFFFFKKNTNVFFFRIAVPSLSVARRELLC